MRKPSPETLRRLRLVGAKVGVFLFVFVVALFIWFPYDRAKEVAVNLAASQGLDVEIESAGPTWGVGVSFTNIHVKTRPTTGKPTRFSIEKASATTSILSILFAKLSSSPIPYTLSLEAFGGRIELAEKGAPGKKGPFRVEITARDVDLAELPGIRETINLPVAGTLRLDLDLASPTGRFTNAKGAISFLCEACVLGDGKAPLKIEGNAFLGGGLTLPKVRLGDLGGDIAIDNGAAKLKGISAKSPDGEISLEGDVALRDPLMNSTLNAYLKFKLSDAFAKSAGTVQTILQMAGASGRRPDGSYGLRLSGRLGAPTMALSASGFSVRRGAAAAAHASGRSTRGSRPRIRRRRRPRRHRWRRRPPAIAAAATAVVETPPPPPPPPPPPAAPPPEAQSPPPAASPPAPPPAAVARGLRRGAAGGARRRRGAMTIGS